MRKKNLRNKVKSLQKSSKQKQISGIIRIHPKGFGFVIPDQTKMFPQDVFIPKHLKKNAIDGDFVEIAIYPGKIKDKGPEGRVLSVLKRAKEVLVGTVWIINPKGNYVLYIQSLGNNKSAFVKKKENISYKIGERLLLKVIDWGDENGPILCDVIEKIGSIQNPKTDILSAIKDFGIRNTFPEEVLKETQLFSKEIKPKDFKERLDLTSLETFTIDPTSAKDYDDALSLSKDAQGFHLAIHIADVSYYVKQGSSLDKEAKKRCNSTYFPTKCIPMLPEALSNELCSLKENVIRLTLSVLIDLDLQGNVIHSKIYRSYIRSQKRLTYEEAKAILDKKIKSPYFKTLKLMEKLCLLLKKKRSERGSIDFALPEITLLVDKQGKPYDYKIVEYDISHQLVEEFMLKANEIVAHHFVKKNLPSLFRIHETPSAENLEDFYSLARILGFSLSNAPSQDEIQHLFALAKNTPHVYQLSLSFIRSMKLAIYSNENVGHYGLALENYCHFTSPIRRYSDLIVHRLLFENSLPSDLSEISRLCSEKERLSFKAETHVILLKKLRLLESYQQKDPRRIYKACITKVKPFGFFFEAKPLHIEGMIHISELYDDFYEFLPENQSLIGKNSGKSFKIGDEIELILSDIDLILMECQWLLLQMVLEKKKKGKGSLKTSLKKKMFLSKPKNF